MANRNLLFAILLIFFSSACAPAEDPVVSQAKKDIAAKMKDPMSTQFRNIKLRAETKSVCGEVNAKNSFGGYEGFQRFYYIAAGDTRIALENEYRAADMTPQFEAFMGLCK